MCKNKKILICDEDERVHQVLRPYFQKLNIQVFSAYDCQWALKLLQTNPADLVILDIAMQGMSGKDLCKKICRFSDTPVFILSAKAEEHDRIMGLELGADDYVAKPFSPREVAVRVQGILRRYEAMKEEFAVELGNIRIKPDTCEVFMADKPLHMTPKEVAVFTFLVRNAGAVVSREKILKEIWGNDEYINTRAVDTLLARIRTKIPQTVANVCFRSVYGIGYMVEEEKDPIDLSP